YKTVENFQKILLLIGVPSVFLLSIMLAKSEHWIALGKGAIGIGEGYIFLPEGIIISTFLAALAYSGAGGNLNLAQAFYIKEKGYGMGKYAGRITSLLTGKPEEVSITGTTFEVNPEYIKTFKDWWKKINIEHFIIFWVTGAVTILLLALLAFSTTFGSGAKSADINFIFAESIEIGKRIFPFAGTFFLLVAGLTLFGTQLTVFDATSRILAENTLLASFGRFRELHIPKIYYIVLWLQIFFGILIFLFGFDQPLQLLITAAVLNAIAMFVHVGLTLWLNLTSLDKSLRPSAFRIIAMASAFVFYGGFSIYTVLTSFFKF
ncbi:MAG: Nramp family divalent metal transporter, partial [Candidatus Levybacteria bacterium]|nr:Nramp family divalent metal transporter [Candidatus Levybacteria bacterium]